jgi:peptidoglycan/LPS O-acetylase OafA/YrhL
MAEIRPLTGLRGVAAITVFLVHMRETLGERGLHLEVPDWVARLFLNGGRQVDIFFVLSGFILTMNYRSWFVDRISPSSYFGFMRRRFARIYPLHFVMLLLIIGFVLAAGSVGAATTHGLDRFHFNDLPAHFLLVHAWGIITNGPGEWNTPSWSISIEALAYLLFPFVTWLAARIFGQRTLLPVALAIAVGFGMNALTPWGLSGFAGIARGLSEFMLGCFVMGLYGTPIAAWLQRTAGSLLAAAALVLCYLLTPDTGFVIAIGAAPLLLTLCRNNVVSRFFGWQPVFFLGEISYSIYLGHFLFSAIAYRLVSVPWMRTGPMPAAAGIALIVAFVLTMSTIFYYSVEQPGRRLLSGRPRKRTPSTSSEALG